MKRNKLEILNTVLLALIVVLQVVTMLWLFMRPDEATTSGGTSAEGGKGNSQIFTEVETFQIDTPYATLKYPSKWEDYLKYEEKEEKNSYAMTFYGYLKEQKVELFSVYFGLPEEGDLIGYVAKDDVQIPFTVESSTIEETNWSTEDYTTLCNMQEDINVLIKSVIK